MDVEKLRRHLDYEPDTGVLRWRLPNSNRVKVGSRAGAPHNMGYRQVRFDGTNYLEHRVVWLYCHGEWPRFHIDHINGDRTDNRIENLRDVAPSENQKNMKLNARNTSGYVGVSFNKNTGKWVSRGHKKKYLGQFDCKATAVYIANRDRKLNGYHKNHGRKA